MQGGELPSRVFVLVTECCCVVVAFRESVHGSLSGFLVLLQHLWPTVRWFFQAVAPNKPAQEMGQEECAAWV
jgi:hypothetical protein